jgi:hypothetical protein
MVSGATINRSPLRCTSMASAADSLRLNPPRANAVMVTQEEVEEPYNKDFHASNSTALRDVSTA